MASDQEDFTMADDDVGLFDLRASGADRLDLPTLQSDSGFESLLDEVIVEGLFVLDDAHEGRGDERRILAAWVATTCAGSICPK